MRRLEVTPMNRLELQEEQPAAPRRMSQDEAREVVELWAERRHAEDQAAAMPSVADIAEALGVTQAEVEGLLAQVRARAAAQEQARTEARLAGRRQGPSRLWVVAGVMGALLFLLFLLRAGMVWSVSPVATAATVSEVPPPPPAAALTPPAAPAPPAAESVIITHGPDGESRLEIRSAPDRAAPTR
jgi:hypothetical protein